MRALLQSLIDLLMEDWPFDQPRIVAVLTTVHVVRGGQAILYASRDRDDGSWQFHSMEPARVHEAMVVALDEIIELDPSILEIADLEPGWAAERVAEGEPWRRFRPPAESS